MSKHYRPSNGTEGECFICNWCDGCTKNRRGAANGGCRILAATLLFDIDDADYPSEWRYGDDGQPICTAFNAKADIVRSPRRTDLKRDKEQRQGSLV